MGVGRELGGQVGASPGGWSAEIRIPIRVLRFDGSLPVQSWGLQAARFIAERQETNCGRTSRATSRRRSRYLGGWTTCAGLKGGGALELIPFGVGYARRQDAIEDVMRGQRLRAGGSAGLNLKWHLANDVTLDAAFNPDFAQVEADQVILNLTNFETLPAREAARSSWRASTRSRFRCRCSTRGASARRRSRPTVASEADARRRPARPRRSTAPARWSGGSGPAWTLGALSAVTGAEPRDHRRSTPMDAGDVARPLAAPATAFNVLRLKRELGRTPATSD